jgi:predicted CoA-binding protein
MKNSLSQIADFMKLRTFAIIGVSSKKKKFGNYILSHMLEKELRILPIHRSVPQIDGIKCYPSIDDLPIKPDAVILVIPPAESEKALVEIYEAGVKNVWLQQGAESNKAITYCIQNDINVISGECILMFLDKPGFPHNVHKWVWSIGG